MVVKSNSQLKSSHLLFKVVQNDKLSIDTTVLGDQVK